MKVYIDSVSVDLAREASPCFYQVSCLDGIRVPVTVSTVLSIAAGSTHFRRRFFSTTKIT